MEIKKTQDGSELTLAVTGRLDTNTSKFLEAELKKSIGGITLLSFLFFRNWSIFPRRAFACWSTRRK